MNRYPIGIHPLKLNSTGSSASYATQSMRGGQLPFRVVPAAEELVRFSRVILSSRVDQQRMQFNTFFQCDHAQARFFPFLDNERRSCGLHSVV